GMNLERILTEHTQVVRHVLPSWIVEALAIKDRKIQVELLKRAEVCGHRSVLRKSVRDVESGNRRAISRSHGKDHREGTLREGPLSREPQLVDDFVVDGSERSPKLEVVFSSHIGERVFKLVPILECVERSCEVTPEAADSRYDERGCARCFGNRSRRVVWR